MNRLAFLISILLLSVPAFSQSGSKTSLTPKGVKVPDVMTKDAEPWFFCDEISFSPAADSSLIVVDELSETRLPPPTKKKRASQAKAAKPVQKSSDQLFDEVVYPRNE